MQGFCRYMHLFVVKKFIARYFFISCLPVIEYQSFFIPASAESTLHESPITSTITSVLNGGPPKSHRDYHQFYHSNSVQKRQLLKGHYDTFLRTTHAKSWLKGEHLKNINIGINK